MSAYQAAGFSNGILYCNNVNFTNVNKQVGQITADGQLLIGNAVFPFIRTGTITSPLGTLAIGYAAPNITLDVSGVGVPEWTSYVVDAAGDAPYTTIQAALDAANAAGYKLVLVHYGNGNYVEDLTLYDEITVMGIQKDVGSPVPVLITGTHTPPASGSCAFVNLRMNDATAVISDAGANSARVTFINCSLGVTNGFTCDVTASTGVISFENCTFSGLDDGLVNNATGTAVINLLESSLGGGGQILVTSGFFQARGSTLNCEASFTNAASVSLLDTVMSGMTFSGTSTLSVLGGRLAGSGKPSLIQSSSGTISLLNVVIDSNNNPAIDGAGAGIITQANLVFPGNANIAGTLTLTTISWRPYAQAIASTDGTKVGTCAFNSAQFSVDANGFVSVITGAFAWNDISGAFSPLKENGYFITGTATGTLPASPAQGDTIKFFVDHASQVLTIKAAGTQLIRLGSLVSSGGGTAVSTLQGDSVELVYRAANTTWEAVCGFSGTWVMA